MGRTGDHLIGTGVNRSEWRSSSVPTNKNMRSLEESRGKIRRGRGGHGEIVTNGLRKSWGWWREWIDHLRGRQCSELSGESKRSTVQLLSRRDVGGFSRRGAETEEDPGEMVEPVSSGAAGPEGSFQPAVKSFHEAVGLRMVGGGGLMRDVEARAERSPESRGELRTSVGSDDVRHTKTSNPMMHQGGGTVIGGGGGQRNSLRPTGGSVNDGEQVGVSRRGRKGTYQVHMNVGETSNWERNDRRAKVSVMVDFACLTRQTGTAPG